MEKKKVWVVGHKHPDSDSICSAISYAYLKNAINQKEDVEYEARRAGEVNPETAYILERFGVEAPELVEDAGSQVKDIKMRKTEGVSSHISIRKAWDMMKDQDIATLPVVNTRNKLEGLIVTGDIAESYMDVYDNETLAIARTQYKNIIETLAGKLLSGNEHGYFVKGKVVIGTATSEVLKDKIESDDLVILSDREDAQLLAIEENCSCIVVSNGFGASEKVLEAAKEKEVVIISTPYDTFTAARLINQSMPIKFFMARDNFTTFTLDDLLSDVKKTMSEVRHRDFPVVDDDMNYIGMISRRNLLSFDKKQIILVDHNEKSQALNNIDDAEVVEIIDHHKIGDLQTLAPVYFRNQPLGCTGTIVYQMYKENGVEIEPKIAGLLCSAIISDTLMFRSPTCTPVDKMVGEELAKIAGVDVEELAIKMFEAGSNFAEKTEEEILNQDFKIFHAGDVAFGVDQVSAMGKKQLDEVKARLIPALDAMIEEKKIDMVFVMLTDILTESTDLICGGEGAREVAQKAYPKATGEDSLWLEGVVSRKKQLIPSFMSSIDA
ncbi:putative manganese-dependent inorganic diphosphatase [Lachnobacterium bovis]|jgi:manganese-dependent inorganic pyrophosphatase|uniref:inorganic diphosphatase n=1 Tax=Lachnobacterium bovis DSM 14045 TaxID=1122142 RepID=A0A1H3HLD1_9FIRM|nr:putative manganese-dependent inorganic diphosphatase [Lachnobacterium bovis]MBQ1801894.1 putative manganese-dependent inorganic diphosphatase [Lachnobacterium sp.]SDY16336.1 manganese-dependent inorganic pyrophosphatase [Lachnobacterium bovis DSM 14045]